MDLPYPPSSTRKNLDEDCLLFLFFLFFSSTTLYTYFVFFSLLSAERDQCRKGTSYIETCFAVLFMLISMHMTLLCWIIHFTHDATLSLTQCTTLQLLSFTVNDEDAAAAGHWWQQRAGLKAPSSSLTSMRFFGISSSGYGDDRDRYTSACTCACGTGFDQKEPSFEPISFFYRNAHSRRRRCIRPPNLHGDEAKIIYSGYITLLSSRRVQK